MSNLLNNLYCFVGESGSGKDTIVNELCRRYGYTRVISWTTRPPRVNDQADKKSHLFGTIEDYQTAKDNDDIVAETYFDGNYYWVTRQQLVEADLYIVDLTGLEQLLKTYRDKPIVPFYISANKKTRKKRMKLRGDNRKQIRQRLKNDKKAFKDIEQFAPITINNDDGKNIDDCISLVESIIY